MILLCLDHVGNLEKTFGYKRKLNIYAKNGLIWRVTILEVIIFRESNNLRSVELRVGMLFLLTWLC